MGSYMSTFKDDIGFWGTKRRTSRKRRHHRSTTTGRYEQSSRPTTGRSKKEVQAFERGIIVGMKTSFERGTGRSKKEVHAFERGMRSGQRDAGMKTLNERRRRFSMPNGQPMTLGDLRRRSPSEYRSLMHGPTHMAHSPHSMHPRMRRFSAFGRHRRVSPGSPIRSRSNDAANAMRLYQRKRKTNPSYTLKDAWKDIRRRHHSRFGLPTESGVDRDLAFGASSDRFAIGAERSSDQFANGSDRFANGAERSSDRFAIGAERSSDLAFGEEEGYNNFGTSPKVAFGRPSFGRPQLVL